MRIPLRWHPAGRTTSTVDAYTGLASRYPGVRGFAPSGDERKFVFGANSLELGSIRLTAGYSSGFSFSESEEARITLALPLSGSADLSVRGETIRLSTGEMFLSGPSKFAASYKSGFTGLFATVGIDTMMHYGDIDSGRRWIAPTQTRPLSPGESRRLHSIMIGCVQMIDAFEGDAVHFASRLMLEEQLIRGILVTLDPAGDEAAEVNARDLGDDQMRAAQSFIENHAMEGISVANVAQALGISVRSLQVAFRRRLRCTPYAYIQERRLHLAHQALLQASSGQTVRSIARAHGFAHMGRFSAMIQNLTGESPSEILRNPGGLAAPLRTNS
jgi:AraC-like DNA-binding protein